jgi:hypothetical protein
MTNDRASLRVDWGPEVHVLERGDAQTGFLEHFYTPEVDLHPTDDVHRYLQCGNIVPRTITLCASYANNGQMGHRYLSTYARVDCQLKNILVWDYCVASLRQAFVRHSYSQLIANALQLAVLVKEGLRRPVRFGLPLELLSLVAEYTWANFPLITHAQIAHKLYGIFRESVEPVA